MSWGGFLRLFLILWDGSRAKVRYNYFYALTRRLTIIFKQALYATVCKCTIRKKLYLHQEEMPGVSLNSYLITEKCKRLIKKGGYICRLLWSKFSPVFRRFLISYLIILMIPQIAGYASYRASIEAARSAPSRTV